jgi:type II secretory pathway component GspD/PulD (secretin)
MRTDLDAAARALRAASSERGAVLINRRLGMLIVSDYVEVVERQKGIANQIEGRAVAKAGSLPAASYSGATVDIHLRNMSVRDFVSVISKMTGLATVVDPDVKGTISANLRNVAWDEALEAVLKTTRNRFAFHRNVLEVIPDWKDDQGEVIVESIRLRREDPLFFEGWRKSLSSRGSLVADRTTRMLVIRDVRKNAVAFRNVAQRIDEEVSNASRKRLIRELTDKGLDAAFDLQKRLGRSDPDFDWGEAQWNDLAYSILDRDPRTAVAVFKRIVADNPQSSNAYDSLGEAYMKSGQKTLAIANYRRSLELDPQNGNARRMLKELEK